MIVTEIENKTTERTKSPVEIKEIIYSKKGLHLKCERIIQGKPEEIYYPKRSEESHDFSDRILTTMREAAELLLNVCGLDEKMWGSDSLEMSNLKFKYVEDKNGLEQIWISAKLSVVNDLVGLTQSFTTPWVPNDVIVESGLIEVCKKAIAEATDFYNGKTKYEQTSLF